MKNKESNASLKIRLRGLETEFKDLARKEMVEGLKHDSPEYDQYRERAEQYKSGARLIDQAIGRLEAVEERKVVQ